jgi:hypothetical protein
MPVLLPLVVNHDQGADTRTILEKRDFVCIIKGILPDQRVDDSDWRHGTLRLVSMPPIVFNDELVTIPSLVTWPTQVNGSGVHSPAILPSTRLPKLNR